MFILPKIYDRNESMFICLRTISFCLSKLSRLKAINHFWATFYIYLNKTYNSSLPTIVYR